MTRDDIEERVAIMAEGNGWSQERAERTIAWMHGYGTWWDLLSAIEKPAPM